MRIIVPSIMEAKKPCAPLTGNTGLLSAAEFLLGIGYGACFSDPCHHLAQYTTFFA